MKDQEIIALFFERSERAIEEVTSKYGAAIRKITANILKNGQDAEECEGDTYLQLWRSIPPTCPDNLGGYACRIARNLSLKRYRANTAQKRNSYYDTALDELEDTIPALSMVETEYDAKELSRYLDLYLRSLPEDDRYVFMRRYWYGDGVAEIARQLGTAPHAVSVRLFRLRRKLQDYLMKEGMIA